MSKMSRRKGGDFERACVVVAKAYGLDARRTAPNQTNADAEESDILIGGMRCECKARESLPDYLWDWLKGNDAVLMRRNRKIPLAVIPLTTLLELLQKRADVAPDSTHVAAVEV